jgi:hypothetical protein
MADANGGTLRCSESGRANSGRAFGEQDGDFVGDGIAAAANGAEDMAGRERERAAAGGADDEAEVFRLEAARRRRG